MFAGRNIIITLNGNNSQINIFNILFEIGIKCHYLYHIFIQNCN